MIKPVPPFQWQTPEAQQWVAQQLGLPYNDDMDWSWGVGTPERLEDYFNLYHRTAAAERMVIMEILLQAAAWQAPPEKLNSAWLRIKEFLDQNTDLHASTANHWCAWDYSEQAVQKYGAPIVPFVRKWWIANYPTPTDSNSSLTPP